MTLLPLAFLKMPEPPAWLASRGRGEKARVVAARTDVALVEPGTEGSRRARDPRGRAGFAGLASRTYLLPTILLGLLSATGLLLVCALNTWLPELMGRAGFSTNGSLAFLLVLNGGAVLGALVASRFANQFGPKLVVAASFLLGALAVVLLTVSLPLNVLLAFVTVGDGGPGRLPARDRPPRRE